MAPISTSRFVPEWARTIVLFAYGFVTAGRIDEQDRRRRNISPVVHDAVLRAVNVAKIEAADHLTTAPSGKITTQRKEH